MRILPLQGLVTTSSTVLWTNSADGRAATSFTRVNGVHSPAIASLTPCRRPRTAQGRCGSLLHHDVGVSDYSLPVSPAGFSGALRKTLDTAVACTAMSAERILSLEARFPDHDVRQASTGAREKGWTCGRSIPTYPYPREIGPKHSHSTCHSNPKGDGAQLSFVTADEKNGSPPLESRRALAACKLTRKRPPCEQSERAGREGKEIRMLIEGFCWLANLARCLQEWDCFSCLLRQK